jgi:hypothetical protein
MLFNQKGVADGSWLDRGEKCCSASRWGSLVPRPLNSHAKSCIADALFTRMSMLSSMPLTTGNHVRRIACWRDESTMNPFEKIGQSHSALPQVDLA